MNDMTTQTADAGNSNILDMTTSIVVAFVSNSHVHVSKDDLSGLITTTFQTLNGLGGAAAAPEAAAEAPAKQEPAVSIRASVKPDYLVCLEDGAKVKMLKRYLMTNFNLTPEQYRAKWGLPSDYPMVSPNYSAKRRDLAKAIGLGTKGRAANKAIETLAEVTETDPKIVAAEAKGETPKAEASAEAPKARRGGRKPAAAKAEPAPKRRTRAKSQPEAATA